MAIDHPLQVIDRNSPSYSILLDKRLGKDAPDRLWAIDRLDLISIPIVWRLALEEGRLLLLSIFPAAERRMTASKAELRNQMVAALADEVFFAHITPGGRTSRLSKQIAKWGIPIVENS